MAGGGLCQSSTCIFNELIINSGTQKLVFSLPQQSLALREHVQSHPWATNGACHWLSPTYTRICHLQTGVPPDLPTFIELQNGGMIRPINLAKCGGWGGAGGVDKEGGVEWKDSFTLTYNIYFLLFHHRSTLGEPASHRSKKHSASHQCPSQSSQLL